jgi:integrase
VEDTTFIQALRAELTEEDLAESTIELTVTDARQFEEWYEGTTGHGLDPDDIQVVAVDLQEYRGVLQRRDLAPATIRRKFASLRKSLSVIAPAVALSLRWPKLPKEQRQAPSGFTRSERNAIIRAAQKLTPRDSCIIQLLLNTGARASSIADVRIDDVVIRARSGQITFRQAKGNKTYTVPLNIEARTALEEYLEVRPPVTDHDRLFCSMRFPHPPISRQVIWSVWHERMRKHLPKKLAEKIRGPHQARHDLARRLLTGEGGTPTPPQDVAQILGHAGGDPRITLGIYGSPSEEDLRDALNRMVGDEGEED